MKSSTQTPSSPTNSYVTVGPNANGTGTSGFCPKCNTCTWVTNPDGTTTVLGCACNLSSPQIVTHPYYITYPNPAITITPNLSTPTDEAAKALQKAFDESAEEEARDNEIEGLKKQDQ